MLFCAPVWNRGRQKQRHLSETFRQDRSAGSKGFAGKSPHIYAECCGCMLSCSYCYQKDRLWLSDCFAVVRNRYGGALNFDIIHLITGLFDILRSKDYIRGYLRKCNWIYISCYFPIVTKRGITGGVSFMDGYVWGLRHLTIPQTRLLERLSAQLFGEDLQLMQEILHTFSEPISMNFSGDDL